LSRPAWKLAPVLQYDLARETKAAEAAAAKEEGR
jgi:hypothetical protein